MYKEETNFSQGSFDSYDKKKSEIDTKLRKKWENFNDVYIYIMSVCV